MAVPPRHDVLGRRRERVDGLGGRDGGLDLLSGTPHAAIFGLERSFGSRRGLREKTVFREAAYSQGESGKHREAMCPMNVRRRPPFGAVF